jgi:hypothetical protein
MAAALIRLAASIAAALLVAATTFFAYPLLNEDADGECSALEQRVRANASHDSAGFLIVGQLYGSSSSEPSGEAYARDRHPMLPAVAGCALEYWRAAFDSPPPARLPAAPSVAAAPSAPARPPAPQQPATPLASVTARGITPNGDPISPASVFTLPLNSIAIRVDYEGRPTATLRFQLMQGKAVLATCPAERVAGGPTWCNFNVELRKGLYSITFTADRELLGQFPFTVIGR